MKRFAMLTLLATTIGLFAIAPRAQALSCKASVLEMCYSRCREAFSIDALRASCCAGCMIGCITSGTN